MIIPQSSVTVTFLEDDNLRVEGGPLSLLNAIASDLEHIVPEMKIDDVVKIRAVAVEISNWVTEYLETLKDEIISQTDGQLLAVSSALGMSKGELMLLLSSRSGT